MIMLRDFLSSHWRRVVVKISVFILILLPFGIKLTDELSKLWSTWDRTRFLDRSSNVVSLFSIALFVGLVYVGRLSRGRSSVTQESSLAPPRPTRVLTPWALACLLTFLIFSGLIFMVNPRGIYMPRFFTPWANPSRPYKPSAFINLNTAPDLVIMGSSRAFSIQPTHIQETLGLSAFNFSLDGGGLSDHVLEARFMAAHSMFPRVLFVEIQGGFYVSPAYTAMFAPYELLNFMPLDMALLYFKQRFEGLFSSQQFTEALYILQYYRSGQMLKPGWVFDATGSGMATYDSFVADDAEKAVAEGQSACGWSTPEGIAKAEELIDIARAHHAAVVFYKSPVPTRFFDARVRDNPQYEACLTYLRSIIGQFQAGYPLVYFLDFTNVESIGGVSDETGFYDFLHMTPLNNNRLVDAAAPTLLEAFRAAQNQASNGSNSLN